MGKVSTSIRMDKAVHTMVADKAKKDDRSFNYTLESIAREYFDLVKQAKPSAQPKHDPFNAPFNPVDALTNLKTRFDVRYQVAQAEGGAALCIVTYDDYGPWMVETLEEYNQMVRDLQQIAVDSRENDE